MDSIARDIIDLGRRGALRGALAIAALAALPGTLRGQVAGYPFSLGVASGDPWPDGVVLWTRLATEPLALGGGMGDAEVALGWEVAADEGFARILQRGTARATVETGHAVHVVVSGLVPARPYWYRFTAMGAQSPVGRTRTAPAPGDVPARLRLVNAGCQMFEHGHFTAWGHVAAEAPLDAVFHYGDYIYERGARAPGVRGWGPRVRDHLGGDCLTLADYRRRHAQYRAEPDLQAAHAAHPFIMTFDDHEVENNWAATHSGRRDPEAMFLLRRAAAFQAWRENMPVRVAFTPPGPGIGMHRRFGFGRLLTLHALDTRQYRDPQPCNDGFRLPCAEVSRPEAQMLGATQEAWLLDGVARAGTTWQVLGQQVMMMRRERQGAVSMDSWDGYPAARARLLAGLHERRANTVVLTGDVHAGWAGTLRLDPQDPGSAAVATEFVGTSITSEGNGTETVGNTEATLATNPHIAFYNNRRGYTLLKVTAQHAEAAYRAVPFVTTPGAPLEDRGRFVVEPGRPVPRAV